MKIQRLNAIIEQMRNDNITQMLVTDPTAIFYLTGNMIHPGERLIAIYLNVNGNHKFFINKLFPVHEDLGIEKIWFTDVDDILSIITENVDKHAAMGVDKNLPARFLLPFMNLNCGDSFINTSYIIDTLRMCKDDEEKDLMRKASQLNDEAMRRIKDTLPNGLTEKQLASELSKIYEEIGADGFSFKPIVGFGANGADPHASAGNSIVKEGDAVIFDIGCVKDQYCSDMTRTVFYKKAPEKAREVFEIVLEANKRAISLVKPGVRFCDIDAAARDYITEKGYGKYFTHRTGHSIGIEVHEMGDVSATNTTELKPGMIFSVEPGIYLPGEFGVRIEDLIMVTEDGYENLNKHNKELCIIG